MVAFNQTHALHSNSPAILAKSINQSIKKQQHHVLVYLSKTVENRPSSKRYGNQPPSGSPVIQALLRN